MGIGKSAACLQVLSDLFLSAESTAALIIAPLRVISLTWPSECRDWDQFQWLRVANLRNESGQRAFLNGSAHLYLINYEAIPTLVSLVERRKGKVPYDVVIYDESTRAKNPSSKRISLLRRKVPRVKRNIALTGTPIPNSYLDIFAQVRLVDGGERLGTAFAEFKRQYFYPPSYQFQPWKPKKDSPQQIEQRISDITLTLKSSDWLQIPDTQTIDIEIPFTPELQKKYHKMERDLVIELKKDHTMNIASAATLVVKLLQFTSGHIYDEAKEVHPIHNLKFDALAKLTKEEKQPLLVACIFQHEQDRIRSQFPQARFFADAKNETSQRQLLADWNARKIPMLVAHPASVSHGLNMQFGSSVMVWISMTYSRESYEQMIARLARRGQTEITKVYRLLVPGSVDEAVCESVANKAENESRLISALQMLESYRTAGG